MLGRETAFSLQLFGKTGKKKSVLLKKESNDGQGFEQELELSLLQSSFWDTKVVLLF